MEPINLYTDGSSRGNPGPGGYGIVLTCGPHRKEMNGGFRYTTNNRMELLAVIIGLETIRRPNAQVNVYSESSYVVKAVNEGWLAKWLRKGLQKQKNADLWSRYVKISSKHQLRFFWIKGHAGHPENERCDQLAVNAALSDNLAEDTGYIEQCNGNLTQNIGQVIE